MPPSFMRNHPVERALLLNSPSWVKFKNGISTVGIGPLPKKLLGILKKFSAFDDADTWFGGLSASGPTSHHGQHHHRGTTNYMCFNMAKSRGEGVLKVVSEAIFTAGV